MSLILPRRGSKNTRAEPSAWRAALDQFRRELDDDEEPFFQTTRPDRPEALLNEAMVSEIEFSLASPVRGALRRVRNTIEALDQFKVVVDMFAEIYPAGLAPIWGCMRVVMHTALQWERYFDRLAEMFEKLARTLPRLNEYERMYGNKRFMLALQAAYLNIIEFCVEVMHTFRKAKKSTGARFKVPFLWRSLNGTFEDKLKTLEALLANVKEEAETCHMRELAQMREGQASEDWERLIQFLIRDGKHRKFQATMNQVRHAGTCEWLVENSEFQSWSTSNQSRGIWLHGPVGSGKTVLCSYVVESVQRIARESSNPVAYYYCDHMDRETLAVTAFIECIIGQLLSQGVSRNVQDVVLLQYKSGRFPELFVPVSEALDTLTKIISDLRAQGPISIIVDGIDECEKDDREQILSALNALLADAGLTPLKVIITSRDFEDIRQALGGWTDIKISKTDVGPDIQAFVEDKVLRHLAREGGDPEQNKRLAGLIIPTLVQGADGMFLLVSMQLALIFTAATEFEIEAILDDLPVGLLDTYKRILRRILQACQTVDATERVRKAFQWVYAAKRPLTLPELAEAVAFSPEDESWDPRKVLFGPNKVVDACKNLIILEEDGTARFTHSTVQEFLLGHQDDSDIACFHFKPEEANLFAAQMVVSYLSFSDFETVLVHKGRALSLTDAPVPERTFIATAVGREPRRSSASRLVQGAVTLGRGDGGAGLDFAFTRNTLHRAMGSTRNSGSERHSFLKYVSTYWLDHCGMMLTPEATGLWTKFARIVLEKHLEFDFRPWEGEWAPKNVPKLPIFNYALKTGNMALLRLLSTTRQSPSADVTDVQLCLQYEFKSGVSPLKRALQLKSPQPLEFLLQYAKPEMLTWERLFEAVREGGERLRLLLDAGIDPSLTNTTNSTALHEAAKRGLLQPAVQLLERGADIDARDTYARTPLHTAIFEGNEMTALLLLGWNPDPDTRDSLGHSPLMDACEKGMVDVVRILRERGADVNVISSVGQPLLHFAVSRGEQDVVKLLVSADDLDINVQDNSHYSALHGAAEIDHDGIARLLLDRGIDPGLKDENGELALHYCSGNGDGQVLKLLLEFGMKEFINATGPGFETTPLQWAVRKKRLENARTLIEHGADVNLNRSGMSALHYVAAETGQAEMAMLLVRAGASVTERDRETGRTPLQFAEEGGFRDVVKILEDALQSQRQEVSKILDLSVTVEELSKV